jgi:glycopeptide antibiotics resistance protein
VDFSTNVLLFFPTSFAWMGTLLARRQTRASLLTAAAMVLGLCMATGLFVELGQVWFADRVPSSYDLLAHLIGSLAGIAAWSWFGPDIAAWVQRFRSDTSPAGRLDGMLTLYLAGLVVYSVLPLDLTLHPVELLQKYRRGRIEPIPFTRWSFSFVYLSGLVLDTALYVPVGAWCRRRFGGGTPWWQSVLIGGWIVAGIECLQLLVMSRFTDATDVVTGTAGVAIGVRLADHFTASRVSMQARAARAPWLTLTVVYAMLLVVYFGWPLVPTADGDLIRRRLGQLVLGVPFGSLNSPSRLSTVSHFLEKLLLFAPLGALAACSGMSLRLSSWWLRAVAVTSGAVIGLGIEVLQTLLPDRTPDLGDALLCALGSFLGAWTLERLAVAGTSRFRP